MVLGLLYATPAGAGNLVCGTSLDKRAAGAYAW
jgi:hypothetical protein